MWGRCCLGEGGSGGGPVRGSSQVDGGGVEGKGVSEVGKARDGVGVRGARWEGGISRHGSVKVVAEQESPRKVPNHNEST